MVWFTYIGRQTKRDQTEGVQASKNMQVKNVTVAIVEANNTGGNV